MSHERSNTYMHWREELKRAQTRIDTRTATPIGPARMTPFSPINLTPPPPLPSLSRDAIAEALESGQLAGYAGDVWFPQPAPKDHPWRTMKNNGMTPHTSGTSLSAQARYTAGVCVCVIGRVCVRVLCVMLGLCVRLCVILCVVFGCPPLLKTICVESDRKR